MKCSEMNGAPQDSKLAVSPTCLRRYRLIAGQFLLYVGCGCGSLVILIGVTMLCEWLAPGHVAPSLPDNVRARNLIDFQIAAFVPANLFAWWANRTFVFKGRRHRLRHELALFFAIAAASFLLGLALPYWLVTEFGLGNALANLIFAWSSAIWNFALRRVLIFGPNTLPDRA